MKYIIRWNAGDFEKYSIIEAESKERAEELARFSYEFDGQINNAYGAAEYTKQLAIEMGLEGDE